MSEEPRIDRLRRMLGDAEEVVRLLAKEIEAIEDAARWAAAEAEESHGEDLHVALLPAGVQRSPKPRAHFTLSARSKRFTA